MNQILLGTLIGLGAGLFLFPIGLGIYVLFKNTFERRRIKKMLKQGKFLITIDEKDFDSKAWTNQKYGNIDLDANKKILEDLNFKMFKRKESIEKLRGYMFEAKKLGFTDEQIIDEFKKKNYKDDFIKEIMDGKN